MTSNELIEEIRIELENIEVVLQELACLYEDVKFSALSQISSCCPSWLWFLIGLGSDEGRHRKITSGFCFLK
jgi:hypothetical protein